jgi:hypothetical protein
MRRALRFLAALAFALAALGAFALFFATEPLDRAPILGTPVAIETDRLLEKAARALRARPPEHGLLRVGWASAPITPPIGTPTLGYGARLGRGIRAVADELFVRALAISAGGGPPLVFLSADLCLWTGELSRPIAERLAAELPRERLYFGATHTHNGPSGFVRGALVELVMGRFDEKVRARIVEAAAGAARRAIADLAPGAYRELSFRVPEFVTNRMRPGEPLDDELYLAEWRKESGRTLALVVYPAHATAIDHTLLVASADWPGALSRELVRGGYDAAMFLAGPTGEAGPALDGAPVYAPSTELAYRLGARLAERVGALSAASREPFHETATLSVLRSEVKLPPFRVPALAGRALRPAVAAWALGEPEPRAFVHAVALGGTVFIGHSFEFGAVIARRLKERLAQGGARLVVTSFNGEHCMYAIPDDYFDDGRYESGATFFGPHLGSYLEKVTERTFEAIKGAPGRESD